MSHLSWRVGRLVLRRGICLPKSGQFIHTSLFKCLDMFDANQELVRPPEKTPDFFTIFQIQPRFDVDAKELAKRFRSIQAKLHPDRFGTRSDEQKEMSESWSSLVNTAYQTLSKPLDRALYMLESEGVKVHEGDVANETSFLADIMELNEEVSEAETTEDIARISRENKDIIRDYEKKLVTAFADNDFFKAKELALELRYFCNIQDQITKKELDLGAVN